MMMRWLAAAGAVILLAVAAVSFLSADRSRAALPSPPPEAPETVAALPAPIETKAAPSAEQREARRLARYDRDKDGSVSIDEYLRSRQRAFAKLDTDGDGELSFAEYSIKTTVKFEGADADKSRALSATEFATTAVVRKPAKGAPCRPTAEADD